MNMNLSCFLNFFKRSSPFWIRDGICGVVKEKIFFKTIMALEILNKFVVAFRVFFASSDWLKPFWKSAAVLKLLQQLHMND